MVGRPGTRWLWHEIQSGRCVRGERQSLDPGAVDVRRAAAGVFEDERAASVNPHGASAAAGARVVSPREWKWFAASQLRGDDELKVGEGSIFDVYFRSTLVDELPHARVSFGRQESPHDRRGYGDRSVGRPHS